MTGFPGLRLTGRCHGKLRHLTTDSCSETGSASSAPYWPSIPSGWSQDGWSGSATWERGACCLATDPDPSRCSRRCSAQEGYHFTVLSPSEGPQAILAMHRFRSLDRSAAFIPNLPWPTLPGRTRISADPDVIERTLAGIELELYRDHAHALAAHHLVLIRGHDSCYVMYREFRYKDMPLFAILLHVSNPEFFHRALYPLTRHLLVRHGLVATLAELRIIKHKPRLSFNLNYWPKMYRSTSVEPEQVDNLYSELVSVPGW